MEKTTNDTQDIIEKAIWKFLEANKELVLRRIIGADGLALTAGINKDITIDTYGTGKALYNGVEIGTGGGGDLSDYMKKAPLAGDQNMYNKIIMRDSKSVSFKSTDGSEIAAGNIIAWSGVNLYDFMVEAPNGILYLKGLGGIRLESEIITDISLIDTKKIYLNSAKTAYAWMNGSVLEFKIPGGKWRVVP